MPVASARLSSVLGLRAGSGVRAASSTGFSYWAANVIFAIAAVIILACIAVSVPRLLRSRTRVRPFCAVVGTPYGPRIWDGEQRKYLTRTLFVLWNRGLSKITSSDIEPDDPVTIEVEGPILEFEVLPYAATGAAAAQVGANVIEVTFEVLAGVASRPNYLRGLIVQIVHESPDYDVAISATIGGVRLADAHRERSPHWLLLIAALAALATQFLDFATNSPSWLRLNYPYQHNIFLLVLFTVAVAIVGWLLAYYSYYVTQGNYNPLSAYPRPDDTALRLWWKIVPRTFRANPYVSSASFWADHAGRWSPMPGQLPGRLPIDTLLPGLPGIPLTLTEPPEGTVGQPYRWTASSKRPGTYTWHAWADQLPPGLSFADSTSGVLRGVPTKAGTYRFPIVVRSMHGARGESSITIVIRPAQRPGGAEPVPRPGR